jgi:hypothetical protein
MKDMDNSSLVVRDVSSDSAARIIVSVAWRRRHRMPKRCKACEP